MDAENRVFVLYLGKRGGGAKFALHIAKNLAELLPRNYSRIVLRGDIENFGGFANSKPFVIFNKGYSLRTFFTLLYYLFRPKGLKTLLGIGQNDVCVVPMLSPLGLCIEKLLELNGVRVLRVLHDARRHPGDFWPPNILIKRIVARSSEIVTLSRSVSEQVRRINPTIEICEISHPAFEFKRDRFHLELPNNYLLFVGRFRKYKGIRMLIQAFRLMQRDDIELVLAGEGRLPSASLKGVKIINKWLTEAEISLLINNSQLVVFPYIEASQSGWIPTCIRENKRIVISPLRELIDQVHDYENVVISKSFSPLDLAAAIEESLSSNTLANNKIQDNSGISKLLELIFA
jgi:glycosyltransferase involved in cell wall biosynthesis